MIETKRFCYTVGWYFGINCFNTLENLKLPVERQLYGFTFFQTRFGFRNSSAKQPVKIPRKICEFIKYVLCSKRFNKMRT